MAVFYALLDIASVNSYILYQSYQGNQKIRRAQFIKLLSNQLVDGHRNKWLINQKLPQEFRFSIGRILKKPTMKQPTETTVDNKRKWRGIWPQKND